MVPRPDSRLPLSRRRHLAGVGAALSGVLAGCVGGDNADGDDTGANGDGDDTGDGSGDGTERNGEQEIHADYETAAVTIETPDSEELGSVTAAIADTSDLREIGLSDTESLPEDRGMLFVYDREWTDLTYIMPRMDFGIDIVFADADGVITSIHHAPEPGPGEDGEEPEHQYDGYSQYVLEVNYEWTTDRGIETGDVIEFDL